MKNWRGREGPDIRHYAILNDEKLSELYYFIGFKNINVKNLKIHFMLI